MKLIGFSLIFFFLTGIFAKTPEKQPVIQKMTPAPTIQEIESPEVISVQPKQQNFLVSRVIDGDTIVLENGNKVRYIGIDTPETVDPRKPVQCFGEEASNQNKQLVLGKIVRLEKDVSETDKYGRLLRYVWVNNLLVNDYLVRQGYAYAATFPPDVKYQSQFTKAQKDARINNRGLWSSCTQKSSGEKL